VGRIADSVTRSRVLVYDIETRPMVGMMWQAYGDQSFSPEQVLDPGGVLCWSARWLDESKIRYAGDHHDGHESMIGQLWELLEAADVVIGYNQVRFDDKRVAREFALASMPLPTPPDSIDLLRAVKARFGFPINKLQHVAAELGVGSKVVHTGWHMWRSCVTDPATGVPYLGPVPVGGGDPRQWAMMRRYCKQDVVLTTDVYYRLRPYVKNHPHIGLHGGALDGCPNCGEPMAATGRDMNTMSRKYPLLRCTSCGANGRSATAKANTSTQTRSL
jgi:hypothetical protein